MIKCINCGKPTATRTATGLQCKKCGHVWTFEEEKSNATYITNVLHRDVQLMEPLEKAEQEVGQKLTAETPPNEPEGDSIPVMTTTGTTLVETPPNEGDVPPVEEPKKKKG